MKAGPILYSGPMIRAMLREVDPKSQTRRIAKLPHENRLGEWQPSTFGGAGVVDARGNPVAEHPVLWHTRTGDVIACPYGSPGDYLYVRETFSGYYDYDQEKVPPRAWFKSVPIWYWADGNPDYGDWTRPKPGIHMPRWASRLTLRITDVRVERLQDISRGDAMVEGCPFPNMAAGPDPRVWYAGLWEAINGPGSWDANPWVWCVSFDVIKQNVDQVIKECA